MELDKRILPGKRPLTPFDVMESKFIGTECYFSNYAGDFRDLSKCQKACLLSRDGLRGTFNAEKNNSYANFEFCLPVEFVQEEEPKTKYRPYTLDTWGQDFKPGDVVFFRGKEGTPKENNYYKCMYLGYLENENNRILVILGPWLFSFFELFELYEIYRGNTWEPFGNF